MNLVGVKRSCTSDPLASYLEFWYRNFKLKLKGRTKFTLALSLYRSHNIWVSSKVHLLQEPPSPSQQLPCPALEQGAAVRTCAVSKADICQGEATDLLVSFALEILALSLLNLPGEVGVLMPALGGGQCLILSSVSSDIPAGAGEELWGQPPDSSARDVPSRASSKCILNIFIKKRHSCWTITDCDSCIFPQAETLCKN